MPHKSKRAGNAHPAAIGLQLFLRNVPTEKKSDAMRELKRTTGMKGIAVLEHLGNRAKHGMPKPPTQDEIEAENRMAKLNI
jgi:hypothetical protein